MSGPLVMSASTAMLTSLLHAELAADALVDAARLANALWHTAGEHRSNAVTDGLFELALVDGLPPQATAIGHGAKISAPAAACFNAACAAGRDDDTLAPSLFASLAIAETQKLTARQFLEAFAIGAGVSRRLASALNVEGARRFIPASAVGQLGAALSVCRALDLDRGAASSALGLAAVQVTGNARRSDAAYTLSVGNAARVGVESALIAGFGANGPQNGVSAIGLMLNVPMLESAVDDIVALTVGAASDARVAAALDILPTGLRELLAA